MNIIKFNPTGTHVENGKLRIRVDIYPAEGTPAHAKHYVDKYDRTPTDEEIINPALLSLIPTHKELNPMLCHFIDVDENTTKYDLETYLSSIFDKDTIATIENKAILDDYAHHVTPLMRSKEKLLVKNFVGKKTIDEINNQFSDIAKIVEGGGKVLNIIPQSIDVGYQSAGQPGSTSFNGYTHICEKNVANATGTLSTFQIWVAGANITATYFGAFTDNGALSLTSHSSTGNLGATVFGSLQTYSGQNVAVTIGDYVGAYGQGSGAGIDQSFGGGTSIYKSGNYLDAIPETTTYGLISNRQNSAVYATGTESGGGEPSVTGRRNAHGFIHHNNPATA